MAWEHDRSLERSQERYEQVSDVEVAKVTRELEFDNISLTEPREVHGAHLYVDIPAFTDIVNRGGDEKTEQETLRRLHLQAREITKVVETDFDAVKVHFQGPKLHAIVYRPIDGDTEIADTAVLAAAAVRETIAICDDLFGADDPWEAAGGIDLGDSVATRDGVAGDRELLFLGTAANRAAKIISSGLRLTSEVVDAVSDDIADHLEDVGDGLYEFDATADELADLIETRGLWWWADNSRDRLGKAMESCPAGRVKVSGTTGSIDLDKLGLANVKKVQAASLFIDVDGFTAYVADAEDGDDLDEAVRAWHVLRSEMRDVAVTDFDAARIQYAGDRMQAIVYLPVDDAAAVALKAVKIAAGINGSFHHTLPQVVGDAALPVAIGIAHGTTLVSRLGEHGDPDVIAVGAPVEEAVAIQLRLDGDRIGIPRNLRDQLPDYLQSAFSWNSTAGCYVAAGLTADRIDLLEKGQRIATGQVASRRPWCR